MTIKQFFSKINFESLDEKEKTRYLSYYLFKNEGVGEFTISFIGEKLFKEGFTKPNVTRLKEKLVKSRDFVKGGTPGSFKLHYACLKKLEEEFPEFQEEHEDVISNNEILPHVLYLKTRGFIEALANQINASYANNIFDGCAVLMRRLMEVLLILAYEHKNIKLEIVDSGTGELKNLNYIINYTISNKKLSLSKDLQEALDEFRQLGNFSAHKVQYNCKKNDIKKVSLKFRLAIEELLYEAGIKK